MFYLQMTFIGWMDNNAYSTCQETFNKCGHKKIILWSTSASNAWFKLGWVNNIFGCVALQLEVTCCNARIEKILLLHCTTRVQINLYALPVTTQCKQNIVNTALVVHVLQARQTLLSFKAEPKAHHWPIASVNVIHTPHSPPTLLPTPLVAYTESPPQTSTHTHAQKTGLRTQLVTKAIQLFTMARLVSTFSWLSKLWW